MSDTTAQELTEKSLYAEHQKIYPLKVSGFFRRLKWFFLINMLAAYYIAPFLRWTRAPGTPDQLILFDIPNRRFYFGPIEIWPQEVYYFTGILLVASFLLFLTTALAGRIWCGWWCPQTIWTDLYMLVERWIEGDRRNRIALDKAPWSLGKLLKKTLKHLAWMIIAWWTGGVLVLYFGDAYQLVPGLTNDFISFWKDIFSFQLPSHVQYMTAWVWIWIFFGTTYLLAGFAREQVCIYMCPWPRIQAALTDTEALNVTYRYDRGEPRGSVKRAKKLALQGIETGDCVDCNQCVWVCPTGTDIRLGTQLSCINCGLCIDACNNVMDKLGRSRNLIAFDTDLNIEHRLHHERTVFHFVRPRTIIYLGGILITMGLMAWGLTHRTVTGINVLHDRNPVFVQESDGSLMNAYTVRMLNMEHKVRRFTLSVSGLEGLRIGKVAEGLFTFPQNEAGLFIVDVPEDKTRELRILVVQAKQAQPPKSEPIVFTAKDVDTGETLTRSDFFKGPGSN